MQRDPIGSEARRARAGRRFGPNHGCTLCPEHDTDALITASRSLIEAHHVVGRNLHPSLTMPLCRNCHAKRSAAQLVQGIELRDVPVRTLPELLADVLLQLGSLFVLMGEWLMSLAQRADTFVSALDSDWPAWRTMSEARA
jgi:hypothetical protein